MNKQYLKICLTLAASLIIVSCSNNTQKNQTSYTITMQTKQHWPQNINFAANKNGKETIAQSILCILETLTSNLAGKWVHYAIHFNPSEETQVEG